jgi:hypothetical protein
MAEGAESELTLSETEVLAQVGSKLFALWICFHINGR